MPGPLFPAYRRLFPEQETLVFDGGLDTKFESTLLPDNESPDCLNVEFNNGSVSTRNGAVKVNTVPAGNVTFDGLYTRRAGDGTSETMCAFIGGHMLVLGATTFNTVPSAQSVFTIGARVGCDLGENYLFIGNGINGPYKWDGTNFTQHGVSAPVQTMLVSSGTTGSLTTNGVYTYVYTNVNTALVESNISPRITFTVSNAGLSVKLSQIVASTYTSQGINDRYIYRTVANGPAGAYFRVAKVGDDTTTTFTDTVADSALGSPAPTDNGTPPLYNAIIYHANILFVNDANNANYVWYSVPAQPYTFPSTNFFRIGDKTSDLVKGFARFDNGIVIFCEQSTWINFMPNPGDPTTWRQIRTNSPYGSRSPYALMPCSVRGENVLLHPAVLNKHFVGFAALSGTTLDPSNTLQPATTAGSDLQSQVIEPDMFNVQAAYLNNIAGIVFRNRAYVSVTYGSGATSNNRIYVWDFSLSNLNKQQIASWVPWTGTPYNVQQFTIYGGNLYGCSSGTSGYVYQLAYTGTYDDDGAAINSYWISKEYPGFVEDEGFSKDWRYINMLYDNAGSYFMNVRYKVDSDLGTGNMIQVYLNSSTNSNWGALTWGLGTWGAGNKRSEARIYLGSSKGKRLQIGFDNQNKVGQRFKVYRAQLAYNLRGYR